MKESTKILTMGIIWGKGVLMSIYPLFFSFYTNIFILYKQLNFRKTEMKIYLTKTILRMKRNYYLVSTAQIWFEIL